MMENHLSREQLAEHIAIIRENISVAARYSGRDASEVTLMAVTKTVLPEVVNIAHNEGIQLFGENRGQELCDRYSFYNFDASSIHFIGTLQRNKVRQIIDKVSCIESVDTLQLAQEIDTRARAIGKTMRIFLEVNIGAEKSKSGVLPSELTHLVEAVSSLTSVSLCGLMAIPPAKGDIEETQAYFDQMHKLFVDIKHKKIDNVNMEYLSMGMSADYQLAIRAGANLVRIGSGLFGSRMAQ